MTFDNLFVRSSEMTFSALNIEKLLLVIIHIILTNQKVNSFVYMFLLVKLFFYCHESYLLTSLCFNLFMEQKVDFLLKYRWITCVSYYLTKNIRNKYFYVFLEIHNFTCPQTCPSLSNRKLLCPQY